MHKNHFKTLFTSYKTFLLLLLKKKTLHSVIRNYEVVLKRQLIKQLFDKTQLIYSELEGAFICKIIHYEYSFSYVWVETGKLLLRDIDNY